MLEANAREAPPSSELWRATLDALRGVPMDFTAAPIGRSLFMLAVPMILEMVMESIFAMVDIFWVGRLGAAAVATVGLTESLMAIVYSLAMGVSTGAMALVSRRIGEKEPEAANRAAAQSIALGVGLSIGVGVLGATHAADLLRLMGADDRVVKEGTAFARVMLGGNLTACLLFPVNAIFRGAGDPAFAMRVLWFGNTLNIVLGPCLIFGVGPIPAMGVTGAAVATNIGRGLAVVYQIHLLTSGRSKIVLGRRHLRLDLGVMRSVVDLSGSATVQMLLSMTSYIGVMRVLATFGDAPLAGYTIGFRILMFALLPVFGLANAAATLVGQNLGAGRPERAEQSVWRASAVSAVLLGAVGVAFILSARPLVGLFSHDPEVVPYGVAYLRIASLGFPFYAYGMVVSQSFNGAGDTRTPLYINVFVFWVLQMPLAWALSRRTDLGPSGVFIALAACFSIFAVLSVALFRRGTWKQTRV